MATPKELVAAVARETGVPLATVVVHDRNLAVAGMRTAAMRGRGTSRVTHQDAANLIIAVAGSRNVKDSAKAVRDFSGLIADSSLEFVDEGITVTRGKTFGDALAALLEAVPSSREAFSGRDADWISISLHGPDPRAVIEIGEKGDEAPRTISFRPQRKRGDHPPFADLQFIARFTQVTLGHVGELVGF